MMRTVMQHPNKRRPLSDRMPTHQMGLLNELIVDSFAGGGGASTGIEAALGHPVHVAINHDPKALAMHSANHPYTEHMCEDVWEIDPRTVHPDQPVGLLWASPDCKHFSKAKGAVPVSKKIRGLAWVVIRWVATRKPRVIVLENVEEFVTWGPLVDGRPCPRRKGKHFNSFVKRLRAEGYVVEWKELRACDFGAPTIRKRLFLIARRDGRPIVWPKPTHGKKGSGLTPYRTAADIIDWSIPCPSIFERKRDLAPNTCRRIAKGIMRYVINNPAPFIIDTANASNPKGHWPSDEPLRTITAETKGGTFAMVNPHIIKVNHTYDQFRGQEVDEPIQTITSKNGYALVAPIIERQFGNSEPSPADAPVGTVTAGGGVKCALVSACLVPTGYGEREGQDPRTQDIEAPVPTVVGKQKHALVSAFLAKHYGGVVGTGVDVPTGTVTCSDHHSVVTAHVMKMRGENIGHGADEPLHTITSGGNHFAAVKAFLIKYYGQDGDPRIDEPLHTITTKDRFGLVVVKGELYRIVDIGMRMLTPRELYRAQGFPDSYVIDRVVMMEEGPDGEFHPREVMLTKEEQVRMCGNSVSPVMSEAIISANVARSSMFELNAA